MVERIKKQRNGYEKVVLICLEILMKMKITQEKWKKVYKDMDRIRDIILDMFKNRRNMKKL